LNLLTDIENLTAAVRNGNYGKCVYEMNNDVCDQQVVNMEFENGATASFSMIAFTEAQCVRKVIIIVITISQILLYVSCTNNILIQTKIFGTHGELEGDGLDTLKVFDFVTRTTKIIHPSKEIGEDGLNLPISGHGGGDFSLMKSFLNGCVTGNQAYIISGPKDTLGKRPTQVFL